MHAVARVGKSGWIRVVDVMTTAPLTVTAAQTVGDALEMMSANGFRQLPVAEGRKLLGMITDRDIRSHLGGEFLGDSEAREKALKTSVGALMTTEPVTLCPYDSLQQALEIFIDDKIGGIPVVDPAGKLLGIVTYVDLLRCFLKRIEED